MVREAFHACAAAVEEPLSIFESAALHDISVHAPLAMVPKGLGCKKACRQHFTLLLGLCFLTVMLGMKTCDF